MTWPATRRRLPLLGAASWQWVWARGRPAKRREKRAKGPGRAAVAAFVTPTTWVLSPRKRHWEENFRRGAPLSVCARGSSQRLVTCRYVRGTWPRHTRGKRQASHPTGRSVARGVVLHAPRAAVRRLRRHAPRLHPTLVRSAEDPPRIHHVHLPQRRPSRRRDAGWYSKPYIPTLKPHALQPEPQTPNPEP